MSGWVNPTQPNVADYTLFLQGIGMNTTVLPANSPWIGYAFNQAAELVNPYGRCSWSSVPGIVSTAYTLAVYNCAAHVQIGITPDQSGQTFFADLRNTYNTLGFLGGVITASGDESTNQTLTVPDFVKQLTLMDLDFMTTPWGRKYLAYAQQYGEIVELS